MFVGILYKFNIAKVFNLNSPPPKKKITIIKYFKAKKYVVLLKFQRLFLFTIQRDLTHGFVEQFSCQASQKSTQPGTTILVQCHTPKTGRYVMFHQFGNIVRSGNIH